MKCELCGIDSLITFEGTYDDTPYLPDIKKIRVCIVCIAQSKRYKYIKVKK